jgi:hypothetical protein
MASVPLSPPPSKTPLTDRSNRPAVEWAAWFNAVFNRLGGGTDKVDAAYQTAAAAAPRTTQVVAVGGLHAGGALNENNVAVAFYRAIALAANLPTTGASDGDWAYAVDGRKPGEGAGAGTGVPVWWTKGAWYAVTSGAAVTT